MRDVKWSVRFWFCGQCAAHEPKRKLLTRYAGRAERGQEHHCAVVR